MSRRAFAPLLGLALLAAAGCRHNCGDRCDDRPFGPTSNTRTDPGCRLTGSGGRPAVEGCFDAVTGQPVPCPPGLPVMPGGTLPPPAVGGTPPNELPFPGPADMIRPPAVPFAPPSVAPGEGAGRDKGAAGKTTGKP